MAGARWLDPITKDYAYDWEGASQRMPVTRHRMLLALQTLKDSSSVLPDGLNMPKRMGANWEQRARAEVQRVIQFLIDDRSIQLLSIVPERSIVGRSITTISYVDLVTGQPDKASV